KGDVVLKGNIGHNRSRASEHASRGGSDRRFDYVPQCVTSDSRINRVERCSVNCSHISQELSGLGRNRVRDIDDVLVAHLERGCEEIARGIPEINVVDYGDDWPLELSSVDSDRFRNVAGLASIEKY